MPRGNCANKLAFGCRIDAPDLLLLPRGNFLKNGYKTVIYANHEAILMMATHAGLLPSQRLSCHVATNSLNVSFDRRDTAAERANEQG
ncbi:hypothetical protein [Sphingomonas zeicaulis]|uniref:hypothetical protein n=1 Tax=Sphingomonas zeicaulis TaxID=1632740 RepID=UPI003D1A6EE5